MSLSLKPTYLRTFSGVVWKMVYDPYHSKVALEIRSEESLEWFYHVVNLNDLTDQQVFLDDQQDWWSRLSGIYKNCLILMRYENQNNPGPGTFLLYDYLNSKILRKEENVLIKAVDKGKVLIERIESISEKEEIEILLDNTPGLLQKTAFPVWYDEDTEDYRVVERFVLNTFQMKITSGVEYYEYGNNSILFSYYISTDKKLDRFIVVIKNDKVILHEKIDEKMNGIATESFFLFGKFLIFVANRKTLKVYEA